MWHCWNCGAGWVDNSPVVEECPSCGANDIEREE